MHAPDDAESAAVFDFLADYLDDIEQGAASSLTVYLTRFPGHEEAIVAEYQRQEALRENGAGPSGAGPSGEGQRGQEPGRSAADESEQLVGPYRLLHELGRGGQGTVWLAEDTRIDRRVALKLIGGVFVTEERRRRFRREAESIARLAHPGICAIHEAEIAGDVPYIAMQHVEGSDLASSLATERSDASMPWQPRERAELARVLHFFERAARALHAAHEAGLVHRDIKPANLVVTPEHEPVLLDFGLARDTESVGDELTRSGEIFGTPAYMSPEQLRGASSTLDRRTDVYSLGATLYEALTGERPYGGNSRWTLEQSVLFALLPDPRAKNESVTDDVRVVLETALEKDRERRYASALELAEDLRRIREYEPVHARPAGTWLRLSRWAQRQPALATALATTFVLLAGGLAVSLTLLRQVTQERNRALGRHSSKRAIDVLESDPALAVLLGIDAVELLPDHQSRSALLAALDACHLERVLEAPNALRFYDLALTPDGTRAVGATSWMGSGRGGASVGAGPDGRIFVWDVASGEVLFERSVPGEPVRSLALHPSGRVLLYGTEGGRVVALDLDEGRQLFELTPGVGQPAGERAALWLEFASNGSLFVVQLAREGALLYDFINESLLRRFASSSRPADELLPSELGEGKPVPPPAGQARISADHTRLLTSSLGQRGVPVTGSTVATLWNLTGGDRIARLEGHTGAIQWAEFSPDGALVVTASSDGTARLWTADGEPVGAPLEHAGPLSCAAFSPDGKRIATTGAGGEARIWNVADGSCVLLEGHTSAVVHAAWSPDGSRLATSGRDLTVQVWTASDGELERVGRSQMIPLASRWTRDGRRVVTETLGYHAYVWAASSLPYVYRLRGHEGPVTWAEFTPDGRRAVTAGDDGTLRVWCTPRANAADDAADDAADADAEAARSGDPLDVFEGHEGAVRVARLGPRGQHLVSLGADRTARFWDLDAGAEWRAKIEFEDELIDADFHPDGEIVCILESSGILWIVEGENEPRKVASQLGPIRRARFRPDGSSLATVGAWPGVQLREPRTGAVRATWSWPRDDESPPTSRARDVAWRADAVELAVLDDALRVHVWELSADPRLVVDAVPFAHERLTWTPAGRALSGWDELGGGRFGHYRFDKGGKLRPAQRPDLLPAGGISHVAHDPSGEWIALVSRGGVAQLSRATSGELFVRHELHDGEVWWVALDPSPGPLRLVTAGKDGAVVWPADPLPAAIARKPRELGELERRRERFLATGKTH